MCVAREQKKGQFGWGAARNHQWVERSVEQLELNGNNKDKNNKEKSCGNQ
jgi:hypothetical protein